MSRKLEKYIADQPQFPPGFQHKTAILVSDSKGYTLRNNCLQKEFPLETWCKSGATTEVLVNLIKTRIAKAIKRHHHIIIYLWSGTCDLTTKEGKYIKLKFHNNRAIKIIEDQYKRAISIIDSYQHAEIKFIDCPLISISNWNKSKGHKRPETYKVEDFLATKQIQELNGKIYELNRRLNKTSVKISKYFSEAQEKERTNTITPHKTLNQCFLFQNWTLEVIEKNTKTRIENNTKTQIDTPIILEEYTKTHLTLTEWHRDKPRTKATKIPCTICQKACKIESIACDDCDKWTHRNCIGMSTSEYSNLGKSEDTWTCPSCCKPNNSSTKIYFIPNGDDSKHSTQNISTNPLMMDSISEASIPSTSGSSINSPSFNTTSFSTDIPIMTSSPKPTKTKPATKKQCKPLPSIGNSDHDIVLLDMACKPLKPKPVRRKIFLWKKAEIHNIKEDLQNFITTFKNIKDRSVESLWQAFKTAVQTTIEKRVPTKMTLGRNTHPWINTTIRRKINQKQKAHKKARKTKKKRDKDRYKRLQQEVQWEVRQANKKYMEEVSSDYRDNAKKFWSYIKSKVKELECRPTCERC
ncbi:unnamed protein product [Mytilus edulis]|uniref:PHD-type domain-containing protein n=1 Tax=Mytilus edulis TaxID=6550 RepID=A0A8S3T1Z3_MYTED|nr:unnamed protein product [Mytilus edulis]